MPRTSRVDDSLSLTEHRRASGRTRKPTAKLEALVGTKFNLADTSTGRAAPTSNSSGLSVNSVATTPVSPQSETMAQDAGDLTSPSTVSINQPSQQMENASFKVNQSIEGPSPADSMKRESRRARKPTQRALEATETMPTTRRKRQGRSTMSTSEARSSVTPPEMEPFVKHEDPPTSLPSPKTSRGNMPKSDISLEEPQFNDQANTDVHKAQILDLPAVAMADNHVKSPEKQSDPHTPETKRSRRPRRSNLSLVLAESEQTPAETSSVRRTRGKSTAQKLDDSGLLAAAALNPWREEPITVQEAANEELDTPNISKSATSTTRRKRTRADAETPVQDNNDTLVSQNSDNENSPRRPKRSVKQPVSYASVAPNHDDGTDDEVMTTPARRSQRGSRDTPSVDPENANVEPIKVSEASQQTPVVDEPRKSLKIVLPIPGLKRPLLPSKLRYSMSVVDHIQNNDTEAQPENPSKRIKLDGTAKGKAKSKVLPNASAAKKSPPQASIPKSLSKAMSAPKRPAEKLSRRAQAKVDAQMLGKVRQAAVPRNQQLYDISAHTNSASYYAPSARLMSPMMQCNLFCLDPAARILAFAQIAAESSESDEDESSENGHAPQLYEKWLEKGRDRFCVCSNHSHGHTHAHHDDEAGPVSEAITREKAATVVDAPPIQNEDLAAVVPKDTVVPIEVPPVNSIMKKSQGRRVSALYNVMAGNSSSGGSGSGSYASHSHSHSPMEYSPGYQPPTAVNGSATASNNPRPVNGKSPTPPNANHNGGLSFEERMRWDQQMLERIRRDARDGGVSVTLGMSYNDIKALLDAKKSSVSNSTEATPAPTAAQGSPRQTTKAKGRKGKQSAKSIEKAQKSPVPQEVPDSDEAPSMQATEAQPTLQPAMDDDDRLMQIIGDSVRYTMQQEAKQARDPAQNANVNGMNGSADSDTGSGSGISSLKRKANQASPTYSGGKRRRLSHLTHGHRISGIGATYA